ncbi:hypothetical protein ACSQ67_012669 [Phaseolus vulgaris]
MLAINFASDFWQFSYNGDDGSFGSKTKILNWISSLGSYVSSLPI